MMKKTLLVGAITLFSAGLALAQTKNLGNPMSWNGKIDSKDVPLKEMPAFNLEEQLEADAVNNAQKNAPYRFGYEHIVEYNLQNAGQWTVLPSGNKIWRIALASEGALSINLVFNDFKLAKGAKLHVYNADHSSMDGAYTSENNNENDMLGTSLIKGDQVMVELFEPKDAVEASRLQIGMIVHGYKDINNWYTEKVNESGGCNMDVVCPDGADWNDQINAVARILNGGGLCTGTLVNNTTNDGTPYFLTANHCGPQNMGAAVFRFNYKSPTCGSQNASDSQNATTNNTVNGSVLRARRAESDFGLVELNSIPPASYGVYYAGWDNSGVIPSIAVGIHHPAGDVMKISFDDDPLTSTGYSQNGVNPNGTHWRIETWERNTTTEGGSSGSAIFDANKRVVGQLHGGGAACGNTDSDWYGRVSISWDGSSSSERLRDWLDPSNTGTNTVDGFDPNGGPSLTLDAGITTIYSPTGSLCASSVTPEVGIRNFGSTTLTSLTINYSIDGGANQSFNWTGSLAQNNSAQVALPASAVASGNHNIVVTCSNPNGGNDQNSNNNSANASFSSISGGTTATLELQLDCYGSETTWEIKDGNTVLYSGGPYSDTWADAELITETFCLDPSKCYDFVLTDGYGDGMQGGLGCGPGNYNIKNDNGEVLAEMIATDGNFDSEETNNFCFSTSSIAQIELDNSISIYPNPSAGIFTIETSLEEAYEVKIVSPTGQTIKNLKLHGFNKTEFNASEFSKGIYFVQLVTVKGTSTKKVILK